VHVFCNSKLKTVGGSTKGLHEHLKRVHDVTVLKRKTADESESPMPTTSLTYVIQKNDSTLTHDGTQVAMVCDSESSSHQKTCEELWWRWVSESYQIL